MLALTWSHILPTKLLWQSLSPHRSRAVGVKGRNEVNMHLSGHTAHRFINRLHTRFGRLHIHPIRKWLTRKKRTRHLYSHGSSFFVFFFLPWNFRSSLVFGYFFKLVRRCGFAMNLLNASNHIYNTHTDDCVLNEQVWYSSPLTQAPFGRLLHIWICGQSYFSPQRFGPLKCPQKANEYKFL